MALEPTNSLESTKLPLLQDLTSALPSPRALSAPPPFLYLMLFWNS